MTGRAEGGCSKNSLIGVNIGLDAVKIENNKFFAFELSLGLKMEKVPLPQISLTFCKTAILSLFYLAISKTDEISLSPGTPP